MWRFTAGLCLNITFISVWYKFICLRRWSDIVQMLYKCFVIAGMDLWYPMTNKSNAFMGSALNAVEAGDQSDWTATCCIIRQTQNMCITFVQCWTNVEDVGPTLYKMLYKCFGFSGLLISHKTHRVTLRSHHTNSYAHIINKHIINKWVTIFFKKCGDLQRACV